MKTKEFIKAIKKLGYYPKEDNAIIKIAKSQTIPLIYADVSTKHRNVLQTDYFPFIELTSEKQAELLDVLIEYARTPLGEREEEKVYRLRHKWFDKESYLNFNSSLEECFIGNGEEIANYHVTGTQAEWKKRTGRTWAQLMNEFDAEEAE